MKKHEVWIVDAKGNGYSNGGKCMFVAITVLLQEHGCGGRRKCLGEFNSESDARAFIRDYVNELNNKETHHD